MTNRETDMKRLAYEALKHKYEAQKKMRYLYTQITQTIRRLSVNIRNCLRKWTRQSQAGQMLKTNWMRLKFFIAKLNGY